MDKKQATIQVRQDQEKTMVIEQLKKSPIVQTVCEKLNISRNTYYRWRNDDKEFAKACDSALKEGSLLVNDLAENQLISAIKDKNMSAIIFWLRNNHSTYKNRLDITARLEKEEALTPEQEATVREALRLAALPIAGPPESTGEQPEEELITNPNNTNNEQPK